MSGKQADGLDRVQLPLSFPHGHLNRLDLAGRVKDKHPIAVGDGDLLVFPVVGALQTAIATVRALELAVELADNVVPRRLPVLPVDAPVIDKVLLLDGVLDVAPTATRRRATPGPLTKRPRIGFVGACR